jgi:DHA1 family solute carrier family 18 vesicular amine transporter 1/2
MHAETWQLGAVFVPESFGFFVGCCAFGVLSYKMGQWRVAVSSLLLASISLFVIPFAKRAVHLIGPHFGFGLALGMTNASIMPLLAHLVDARHTAVYSTVYAVAQTSISLGFAVGPVVGGQLVKVVGFSWLFQGLAILIAAATPLYCLLKDPPSKEESLSILLNESSHSSTLQRQRNGSLPGMTSMTSERDTFNYRPTVVQATAAPN